MLDFIDDCITFTAGERGGHKFVLEWWQKWLFVNAFGWKRPDGSRRYRTVFLYIPRKNGKSELASIFAIVLGMVDGELGAQVLLAAGSREQTQHVFRATKQMISADEALTRRTILYHNSVAIPETNSFIKSISSEGRTQHGGNIHGAVIDEVHSHRNRDLIDAIESSPAARRQPMIVFLTTADFDGEESICNEKLADAKKIRDGVETDNRILPLIYEADRDADWTKEETWKAANPNYGVSVKPDFIKTECERAKRTPSYANTFKRLHLNMPTGQDIIWIPLEDWDRCDTREVELAELSCCGGLDLSATTDITALVLAFPSNNGVDLLPHFWIPESRADARKRRDKADWQAWAREGFVTVTPGRTVDYAIMRRDIVALKEKYNIVDIGVDRWNATHIAQELQDDGIEIFAFGQGYQSMSGPSKEFERLVMSGQCRHRSHPVLRWMVAHTAAEMDAKA